MPKAKGGRKEKVTRPVVMSTLSDTDDRAPSPVPAPSPAPATAPAPAPAPAGEVISSSPTGLEGLTQESSPSSQPPAKRLKKQLQQLTHEEEDDMAEWLKSNPCLNNKKLEDYRQNDMKQRLWEDKAAEFPNVDVAYLLGWYKPIRTHFGKLSKIPSGSGAQELTDRDASILTKFALLKTHITRQRGTQLIGVSIKNQLDLNNLLIYFISTCIIVLLSFCLIHVLYFCIYS